VSKHANKELAVAAVQAEVGYFDLERVFAGREDPAGVKRGLGLLGSVESVEADETAALGGVVRVAQKLKFEDGAELGEELVEIVCG